MAQVSVLPVSSSRQRRQFLELPWKIYAGNEHWIPPLRIDQKEMVGYARHPFYVRNQAQTFLAEQDGKPVGRISAIINHAHNERHQEQRGFFGFFESVDSQEVSNALFDAAGDWLRQHGMTDVRGPCSPSMNYECGLLTEGFDIPPTFMMSYNPPYYQTLWENYGFTKADDLYSFWGHVDMVDTLDKKMAFVIEEAKRRFDIRLRPINKKRFRKEVEMFLDIYNKSLVATWGFTPLSEAEIRALSTSLRFLIVPEMTSVAEVDGKPVGRYLGYSTTTREFGKSMANCFRLVSLNCCATKRRSSGCDWSAPMSCPSTSVGALDWCLCRVWYPRYSDGALKSQNSRGSSKATICLARHWNEAARRLTRCIEFMTNPWQSSDRRNRCRKRTVAHARSPLFSPLATKPHLD